MCNIFYKNFIKKSPMSYLKLSGNYKKSISKKWKSGLLKDSLIYFVEVESGNVEILKSRFRKSGKVGC